MVPVRWALEAAFETNVHNLMRAARANRAIQLYSVRRPDQLVPCTSIRCSLSSWGRCQLGMSSAYPLPRTRVLAAPVVITAALISFPASLVTRAHPWHAVCHVWLRPPPPVLQYFDKAYASSNAEEASTYVGVHELCHLTSPTPCDVGQHRTCLAQKTAESYNLIKVMHAQFFHLMMLLLLRCRRCFAAHSCRMCWCSGWACCCCSGCSFLE